MLEVRRPHNCTVYSPHHIKAYLSCINCRVPLASESFFLGDFGLVASHSWLGTLSGGSLMAGWHSSSVCEAPSPWTVLDSSTTFPGLHLPCSGLAIGLRGDDPCDLPLWESRFTGLSSRGDDPCDLPLWESGFIGLSWLLLKLYLHFVLGLCRLSFGILMGLSSLLSSNFLFSTSCNEIHSMSSSTMVRFGLQAQ